MCKTTHSQAQDETFGFFPRKPPLELGSHSFDLLGVALQKDKAWDTQLATKRITMPSPGISTSRYRVPKTMNAVDLHQA